MEEAITSPVEKEAATSLMGELDQIIERLVRSSRDPVAEEKAPGVAFEEAIARIFRFMGFDSERIGGSGDTDVIVRWKNDEGKSIIAIVDGKSKSNGQVSHSDISDVAIDTHKDKNNADFVGIIGPGFSGDTIRNHARKKAYSLITDDQLSEIARAFRSIGLSPQEIGLIFQVPNGLSQLDELIASKQRELEIISIVISRLSREQEILGGLSPRDLFFMSRDTSVSPSLEELRNVVELLSSPEIGALRATGETRPPENTTYVLGDAKRTANRLCALASTILSCAVLFFKGCWTNNTERKEIMKILEELYYGNISPDVKFYSKDSPLIKLARLGEKNREELLEHLNEEEKEVFQKFNDTQAEMDDITHYQKFSYGFKLGVLLMAEVFTGADELADRCE